MASTSMSVEPGEGFQPEDGKGTIRVIVADTQAIFRAGLRKIFALEDDIRVVGQAESLAQTVAAIQKFSADIVIFEAALTAKSARDSIRSAAAKRELPAGGCAAGTGPGDDAGIVPAWSARGCFAEVEPEMLVECLHKVSAGGTMAGGRGQSRGCSKRIARRVFVHLDHYRKVQLTPKEVADCFLRDAGHEEQGNCGSGGHDRASGKESSGKCMTSWE